MAHIGGVQLQHSDGAFCNVSILQNLLLILLINGPEDQITCSTNEHYKKDNNMVN